MSLEQARTRSASIRHEEQSAAFTRKATRKNTIEFIRQRTISRMANNTRLCSRRARNMVRANEKQQTADTEYTQFMATTDGSSTIDASRSSAVDEGYTAWTSGVSKGTEIEEMVLAPRVSKQV
jgi:hypothetical protein